MQCEKCGHTPEQPKSVADMNFESINHGAKFEDYPIGTKVKIVCVGQDFNFFDGETGTVIKNKGEYLGIIVEYDEPREFESGHIQRNFNFAPEDLVPIVNGKPKWACGVPKKRTMFE